jgi:hypothetical protein
LRLEPAVRVDNTCKVALWHPSRAIHGITLSAPHQVMANAKT